MRTIETKLYQYEELSDAAKRKAREWYTSIPDEFYAECVIEDAKEIAALMGWEIDHIYYSGFSYQGDGAQFVGTMRYRKGCAKAVKQYAALDTELHRIALAWQDLQRRHFYSLRAKVTSRGHYSHEYCTSFDCTDTRHNYGWIKDDAEKELIEIGRDFMRWIYKQLRDSYEDSVSDEVVAGNIINNEYEFTEEGKRA